MTGQTSGGTNAGSLWGGRFASGPSAELAALSRSTHFDWQLAPYDIAGSLAHARALAAAGLLSDDELAGMTDALERLRVGVASGEIRPGPDDEDVHGALEARLLDLAGPKLGGRLRAGRSRNDQIATLIRLYLLDHAAVIARAALALADALARRAAADGFTPMPGRTHLQHAQPVLLAHHLLAHAWPLVRDVERLIDWRVRARESPYGAGAVAGNALGLDPELVARELGLGAPMRNSIDATASRDVVAEFAYIAAQLGVDLSRYAEDVILFASAEFSFVRLDEGYSTGSSIMPQKKNPDIAELARGKAGRLIGDLTGLLATLKGLPLGYARDLQEDKEPVFDAVVTLETLVPALTGMTATLGFDRTRMAQLAPRGFSLATDAADWLVRRGTPFREAHEVAGALVRFCEQHGLDLDGLTDAQYAAVSPLLGEDAADLRDALTVDRSIASRDRIGGTAEVRVREQLAALDARIAALSAEWPS